MLNTKVDVFIRSVASVPWLAHAGEPFSQGIIVPDVATGWDRWNGEMMATWSPHSHALEARAREAVGESAIATVFQRVSGALDQPVRTALQQYFDRRPNINANTRCGADLGLWPELFDTILRDSSWACIETILGTEAFFTHILSYYRLGRWPCAWKGAYPKGQIVVL